MSKATFVQDGKTINYKNTTADAIPYGDVVVLTDRIGIAVMDISPDTLGALDVAGVYEFDAEGTAAFAVGQTVYWDDVESSVTATKPTEEAVVAGWVIEPKAQAATKALVKL